MWSWDVIIALLIVVLLIVYVVEPAVSLLIFNARYPNGVLVAPVEPEYDAGKSHAVVHYEPIKHSDHADGAENARHAHHAKHANHGDRVVHVEPVVSVRRNEDHGEHPHANHVSTLVFGVEAPNKEAAARAANYRGPVVRDVVSSSRPTRVYGNSNSAYGTFVAMRGEENVDDLHRFSAASPTFIFNSSTHFEDAREAHSSKA